MEAAREMCGTAQDGELDLIKLCANYIYIWPLYMRLKLFFFISSRCRIPHVSETAPLDIIWATLMVIKAFDNGIFVNVL